MKKRPVGVTLRDNFAAKTMQGLSSACDNEAQQMEKRPVGRPRIPESEKNKFINRTVGFKEDTFEKAEEMRGHESMSSFINGLVDEKYLS